MRPSSWMATGLLVSFLFFVIDASIFYFNSGGPNAGAWNPALHFSSLALPILFFLVLYFAVQWIGEVRLARKTTTLAASTLARNPFPVQGVKKGESYAAKVQSKAAAIEVKDLLAAYHHPDSSSEVRRATAQELASRGIPQENISDWVVPAEELRVPSAIGGGNTTSRYFSATKLRTTFIDLCRIFLLASAISFLAAFGLQSVNLTLPIPIFELSLGLALLGHDWRRKAAGVMVLAFCIIVFVSDQLSVWLPSSLDWFYTNPASTCLACAVAFGALAPLVCRGKRARILLLRPFGQAEMTSALKRVVRKHVGIVGSVFTLSDRHYKPSIAMDVMKFIGSFGGMAASLRHLAGPLLRPSVRIANVWNEGSFRNLARTLAHNFVLDFQSAYSGNQAFNIASSDNWWKYCIELLMHSTDFAVMDISRVSTGSAWEITQLDRRNVLDRCIFIVQEAYAGDALKEIGGLVPGVATPDLHVFGISGEFIEPARFEMALNRMVTAAQAATHSTA